MTVGGLDLASWRTDRSGFVPEGIPKAVVFPRTAEEVSEVLRDASATGTPVVPRGAGTGLAGGASAGTGTIVLDLSRMTGLSVHPADRTASAEPGVITADLDSAATAHGLRYVPDPASLAISTIGGNIATNAGGLRCAKYGVTRDAVLGLDVVLADGRLISTGRNTLKGVAGYDLTGLFVGSEGTLGVIVRATLRLRPLPPPTVTIAASFADVAGAAAAAAGLPMQLSLAELMDVATLRAVDAAQGTRLAAAGGALLIVQTDGPVEEADAAVEALRRTAASVRTTGDPDTLLAARRLALPSIERFGRPLIEDIAVPLSRLADAVRAVEAIADRHGVTICTLAHAGDGNLHPIIVAGDEPSPAVEAAADEIFRTALDLGGTVTGEHGVGVLKRQWLRRELGDTGLGLQNQIKTVFDPQNILNPGKAI